MNGAPSAATGRIDTPEFRALVGAWADEHHYYQDDSHSLVRERWGTLISHVAALSVAPEVAQLVAALEGALDSLEYVESSMPGKIGYGVRQQRIAEGKAALAAAGANG